MRFMVFSLMLKQLTAPAFATPPCQKGYKLVDGQWYDIEMKRVVEPCDGDALPLVDHLWLLGRNRLATELESKLVLVSEELTAERETRKVEVDRLTTERDAERAAKLKCERSQTSSRETSRPFFDSPWVGAGVATVVLISLMFALR